MGVDVEPPAAAPAMGGRVVLVLLLQAAMPWAWLHLGSIHGDFPIAGDLALLGAFASHGCAVAGLSAWWLLRRGTGTRPARRPDPAGVP